MSKRAALSVIIPTLNEQDQLGGLLDDLHKQQGLDLQVIVADGGSQDDTRQVAGNAQWVEATAGRGRQMNQGRQTAQHPELLFLHADSRLSSPTQLQAAVQARQQAGTNTAGHFGLRFTDTPKEASGFYQHLEAKSLSNRAETINGDQGLMISARFFDSLGGFDESFPFLEDQAISQTIFHHGRWIVLPGLLHTSARRFEKEGRQARYFLMMLIMCARRAGLSAFLRQAPSLYPQQAETKALQLAPFLELILTHAAQEPEFWPCMADYFMDNAWQAAFMIDRHLPQAGLLSLYDQYASGLPRRTLKRLLAPALKISFEGPVLWKLRQNDAQLRSQQP